MGFWFLVQFCLYYQFLHREILWAFPGHWDQVRYLQESQDAFQKILTEPLVRGLWHAFASPTPTGNLLCIEAAVLYLFLGTSRLTALLVLFAHTILFQIIAVTTIRWLSKRWSVAAIGLALLLLAATQFRVEGSLATFQIDFAAYCTFGILICLVLRSDILANRRVTLLAAVVASYLILLRFITLVYLGSIAAVFLVMVVVFWAIRWRQTPISLLTKKRIKNLGLAIALIVAICSPVFWHNRVAIHQYYFVNGQNEKNIRAKEVGVHSSLDSILFYPRAIWNDHGGPYFRNTAIPLILLSLLVLALRSKNGGTPDDSSLAHRLNVPLAYLALFSSLLGPYLVLTTDVVKTSYVGNIFMPPLWAIITLTLVCAAESLRSHTRSRWTRYAPTALAAILFSIAVSYQVDAYNTPRRYVRQREDINRVLELHDLIGQECQKLGLQSIALGLDRLSDAFHPSCVAATQRERHQIIFSAHPAFAFRVAAVTEDEVLPGLHLADFVLLTLSGSEGPPYPFDTSMEVMRPKLLEICDREMVPLRETSFLGLACPSVYAAIDACGNSLPRLGRGGRHDATRRDGCAAPIPKHYAAWRNLR